MSTRKEIVAGIYDQIDEDGCLQRTRHGQLEYFTTMHYILRFTNERSKVLEIGAGTGRYSIAIALAKEGIDGIAELYRKPTLQLMFNIHEIEDDYDVFVAFKTMNNRGKRLDKAGVLLFRRLQRSGKPTGDGGAFPETEGILSQSDSGG